MLKSHFQMEKNSQCSIGEIIRLKKWLKKTIKKKLKFIFLNIFPMLSMDHFAIWFGKFDL